MSYRRKVQWFELERRLAFTAVFELAGLGDAYYCPVLCTTVGICYRLGLRLYGSELLSGASDYLSCTEGECSRSIIRLFFSHV